MQLFVLVGAVLFALLVMLLPALAHRQHRNLIRESWRHPLALLFGLSEELGVVVVTYCHPVLGAPTTTAPNGAQASLMPELAAQVFFADAVDVQAVITHNWGLPNSFPTWLWPQVFFNKSLGGGSDSSFATSFTFGLTLTNSVTMNKLSVGTGSGGTYNVYLRKPYSASQ